MEREGINIPPVVPKGKVIGKEVPRIHLKERSIPGGKDSLVGGGQNTNGSHCWTVITATILISIVTNIVITLMQ